MRAGGRDAARRGPQGRPDDAGQVVTAVLVLLALGLIAAVFWIMLPLGHAADLRERSQSAADAAALAGVKEIKRQFLQKLTTPFTDTDAVTEWIQCGTGGDLAEQFAASNDGRVVRYCYTKGADEAQVEVEGLTAIDGVVPQSRATAALGVSWGSCTWTPDLTATRSPSPSPRATLPPGAADDPLAGYPRVILDCGAFRIPFDVNLVTGRIRADLAGGVIATLDVRLEPRLTA
jgi:hypothetical protein